MTWKKLRGMFSTAPQTSVRPVRLVSWSDFCPRASHVVRKPDSDSTAMVMVPAAHEKVLRPRRVTWIRLSPEMHNPARTATSAVRAWDSIKMDPAHHHVHH